MTRKSEINLASMGSAWLLPIVACVVAAASGAIVADALPNPQYALGTIIASFVLWGVGMPLAMMVIVIYLARLMLFKLPPNNIIVSTFLPLGPLGQGGFGIQKLGSMAKTTFSKTNTLPEGAGDTFHIMGLAMGLLLWAFGLLWLFFAIGSVLRSRRFPFNLGWWAFIFPLGRDMPSRFFDVIGTVFSVAAVLLWILVMVYTSMGVYDRHLFVAPCLADLREKQQQRCPEQRGSV
ncbi:hypothetical protein UA08_04246 [Talaromyces atroroseus]|uniref:Sulfite efflux pump SSU1 n=1 Tax=Talaromyces atroroseus TaxID=1441469 RepID=A0A1Q5Q9G0_TALAT|nr:hypothetical protein UA08_04246 [Talaromyces atroroseus]OKL60745.1 hypothetical protein UA08_04246 [Talaromyces atroroseus]